MSDRILTPERVRANEAAAILGIAPKKLLDMAARGEIAAAKIASFWTFNVKMLQRLAKSPTGALLRAAKRDRVQSPCVVYFVECCGMVKIGHSSNFTKRLASIRCHAPGAVAVIATIAGSPAHERRLHQRFAEYRANGEWFKPEGHLADYLRNLGWRHE